MINMLRTLLSLAALVFLNMTSAAFAGADQPQADAAVSATVDDATGNLRVLVRGDAAKTLFDFLTDARSSDSTVAGVGTYWYRLGPNVICGRFQPEADTSGQADVYRCSQLVTIRGRSVADGLDPMIGVGN
jgi:hypothetical protein